jgi:hypothetical protein
VHGCPLSIGSHGVVILVDLRRKDCSEEFLVEGVLSINVLELLFVECVYHI